MMVKALASANAWVAMGIGLLSPMLFLFRGRRRPKYRLSALTEALLCVGPIAGEIADRGSGTDMYIEQFSGDILLNQDTCRGSRLLS